MNSHIAFIKMIFNLIDKQRAGVIIKMECLNNLYLEDNILKELGFSSTEHFVNVLNNFETEQEGIMTEKEFISFLLSQSGMLQENENINDNINEYNNENHDTYHELETEQHVVKQYNSDNLKNELNEDSKEIRIYNNKLSRDLKSKISHSNQSKKGENKDGRIKVSYKDFKDFTNLYKTKGK